MRKGLLLLLAACAVQAAGRGDAAAPLFFVGTRAAELPQARFVTQAPGISASFGSGEILFHIAGATLRMQFEGANAVVPEAAGRLPGAANFLLGKPSEWRLAEPIYKAIAYRNLYPGIDMIYGGSGRKLKSEFLVAPGADPARIRIRYGGAGPLRVASDGSLVIPLGEEEVTEEPPAIYQDAAAGRASVEGRWAASGDAAWFEIGAYDRSRPLVIDPTLSYSTYFGGSGADLANAIAVDSTGAAYIAGFTESTNLPTASPAQNFNAGGNDIFIAKLNPAGDGLVYCTYLGGSGDDRAYGLVVDAAGAAYVTGSTASRNFPTHTPVQSKLAGGRNAFVLKLSPAGALEYSTYLGGNGSDSGNGIAVDGAGNAYIAGETTSINFPSGGLQRWNRGGQDAFLTKISADGSRLIYSTYLGGSNTDRGTAIAVDAAGAAWVAGATWSSDFPTAQATQNKPGGGQDAFLAKLSPDGSTLLFGSYLGGSGGTFAYPESAQGIALDGAGNVFVAGVTSSADFPVLNAAQATRRGQSDAFVTKLTAGGAMAFSTYLGGSGGEVANAVATDGGGSAWVVGWTYSTDLQVTNDALQKSNRGEYDAFVAKVSGEGAVGWLSYLGGSDSDAATAVVALGGGIYVAGWSLSNNFPLVNGYEAANTGNYGAFWARLSGFPKNGFLKNSSFEEGAAIPVSFTTTAAKPSAGYRASAADGWLIWNTHAGTTLTERCTATTCPSGAIPPITPFDGSSSLHVMVGGTLSGVYQIFPDTTLASISLQLRIVSGEVCIGMLRPGTRSVYTNTTASGLILIPLGHAIFNEIVIYSRYASGEFYVDNVEFTAPTQTL